MVIEAPLDFTEDITGLKKQVDAALRHLFSEQNRDPYAPAYGCFDRRYWAWKLVDFPESTFQRNVYPLAWKLSHLSVENRSEVAELKDAVIAGLNYALHIQHKDGSFDQAFPNERSYGATAFLLQPLLEAYKIVKDSLARNERDRFETGLQRAAGFLCRNSETHGLITNHLAGAALSLLVSAHYFHNPDYENFGLSILDRILATQNSEGWFPEYGDADPGYQTLCIHYLAQVNKLFPDEKLQSSLHRAVDFLSWFIHPDGSFAGEYGSRRTSVYYPGGIAMLAERYPLASAMTARMIQSFAAGRTVTLPDIDMGNMAPLLQSTLLALDSITTKPMAGPDKLPCDRETARMDFTNAGLSIRSNKNYFAVIGISNGGVVKVFRKDDRSLAYDDGGYAGTLKNGTVISTQVTDSSRAFEAKEDSISFNTQFHEMLRSIQTPFQILVLRILNLTIMNSIFLGNLIKKMLVHLLIQGKRPLPLYLERRIHFHETSVEITDRITGSTSVKLGSLACGIPFSSIHMASARYFGGQYSQKKASLMPVDTNKLNTEGEITQRIII